MNKAPSHNNRTQGFVEFVAIALISSCVALVLRAWSRLLLRKRRFWWDDYFAFATLVSRIVFMV